jgi:hypothetical protein
MKSTVTIKKIGDKAIELTDMPTPIFGWNGLSRIITVFLLTFAVGYSVGVYAYTTTSQPISPTSVGVITGLLSVTMFGMIGGFETNVPAYHVMISGESGQRHPIIKTTPEQDQIAICRAVKERELEIWEILKSEEYLEQIAINCRYTE